MTDTAPLISTEATEPTQPGWYASVNGIDYLIFLRLEDINIPEVFVREGQWMAFSQDGNATKCDWAYIAQAGPITRLIKEHA